MQSTLSDEELCRALPRPIAADWVVTLNAGSPSDSARAAEQTLITTLRLLFALQLASTGPSERSKAFRKAVTYLDKPGLGSYGELVLALAAAEAPEGTFARRLAEHLRPTVAADQRQALIRLGELRNQRAHGELEVVFDAARNQDFVNRVRAFLVSLRWLAEWQLWLVSEVTVQGEGFHRARGVLLHGTDLPLVRDGAIGAPLRANQVYLRSPDGVWFWELERLVVAKLSLREIHLWLPDRVVAGHLVLSESGQRQPHTVPLVGDPADALLALARAPLRLDRLPSGPSQPARGTLESPGSASPAATTGPGQPPRRSLSRLLVAAGLLVAAASWLFGELGPSLAAGDPGEWRALGLGAAATAPPSPELAPIEPKDAGAVVAGAALAAEITLDVAPTLADADPLAALRALLTRCASVGGPPDPATVEVVVIGLDALEPREVGLASELDAALDLSRACDRAVIAGLAGRLRQRPEQDAALVERTLLLQRRLVEASQGSERHLAALNALADLRRLVGLQEDGLDARLGDPAIERRVDDLLGLGRSLVCALDPQTTADADSSLRLDSAWLLRLDQSAGADPTDDASLRSHRRCLGAALAAAADAVGLARGSAVPAAATVQPASAPLHVAAARRRLEATPCCGAQQPPCGDVVAACDDLQGSAATALALCRDAAVQPTSRRAACDLALTLAGSRLKARGSLSASDPRCLPPWLAPDTAIVRLQRLRRDTPAPTAAWPDGSQPSSPADADLEAFVAATEALAASGADAKAVAGGKLAVARILAAHRLLAASQGECQVATEVDGTQRLRARWRELEVAADSAVAAEARAIGCRLEAVEGDAAALQARRAADACPP